MVRRISFMASSALFCLPILNLVLPIVGCFPKDKGVKDRDAMATRAERYEANEVIMIFPEGNRAWDGRSSRILPGIGRLIKRIKARVVTVRVVNGHLFQPRWATYPRWIPIRCEVDDPTTFDASLTAEEITAEIIRRLHIEPKIEAPRLSFGWRMAHGLPAYLWACPQYFTPNGLTVDPRDGNRIRCHACDAHWRVDTSNRLHGTTDTWVLDALDAICAHFGEPPVLEPTVLNGEGLALRCPETRILLLEKGRKKTLLHEGMLEVTRARTPFPAERHSTWTDERGGDPARQPGLSPHSAPWHPPGNPRRCPIHQTMLCRQRIRRSTRVDPTVPSGHHRAAIRCPYIFRRVPELNSIDPPLSAWRV